MEIAQNNQIEYNTPLKYKEICALFNDNPNNSGSKGRSLQLRKWQQYYDIEKVGMYYYIRKKYDSTELDLIENSGKYTSYITDRLLDYLSCIKDKEITLSFYDIYELTTMVNEKYHKGKNNLHTQDKLAEVQKFHLNLGNDVQNNLGLSNERMISVGLYTFFKVSNKLLRQNVYNALKSMQRKGLIIFPRRGVTFYGVKDVLRVGERGGNYLFHHRLNLGVDHPLLIKQNQPFHVRLGISAPFSSWGKATELVRFVQGAGSAVYPPEAKRFFHGVVVGNTFFLCRH